MNDLRTFCLHNLFRRCAVAFFIVFFIGNVDAQEPPANPPLSEKYKSLDARDAREETENKPHLKEIHSAAIAPNNQWIATASEDGTAKIWDVSTGKIVTTLFGHTGGIFSVSISPTGLYIATGGKDGDVRLWDRTSGECLHIFKGHTGWIWCVDYSPDGSSIASSSHDRTTKIWHARDYRLIRTLSEPNLWSYSCTFSADGKKLLVGYPALAILWDVATGAKIQSFDVGGHENYIYATALSSNGNRAVTGGLDRTLRVWNVQTGRSIQEIGGHEGTYLHTVHYSPDGESLLSCSVGSQYAILSRTIDGKLIRKFDCLAAVNDVDFSPDGKWILTTGYDRVVLWDAKTFKPVREFPEALAPQKTASEQVGDATSETYKGYRRRYQ